ncbi:MAG: hypothetical protein SGPRY_000794 [Prymnesium sp.]
MDLAVERPSVLEIMEDYWEMLPTYQDLMPALSNAVTLEELTLQRVLFGLFVSYKSSPLPPAFDRILQVGDASGIQSPLSFGGFGAITRHLRRLTLSVCDALHAGCLTRESLGAINPYQPSLRAAWLFQAAMRPPPGAAGGDGGFISRVLVATFETMERRGDGVMMPFLQDVLRVDGLVQTIGGLMLTRPLVALEIVAKLGPGPIADWFIHFALMCVYSVLAAEPSRELTERAAASLPPAVGYSLSRSMEAWQYGSGLDYTAAASTPISPEAMEKARTAAHYVRSQAKSKKRVEVSS